MPSASVTESIKLTESHLGDIAPAFMGSGETVTVAESLTMGTYVYPMVLGRTEDVAVTETITLRLPSVLLFTSDTVTVIETIAGSSPGAAITVAVVESLSIGETNARTISPSYIFLTDAVSILETITATRATSSAPISIQTIDQIVVIESHLGDVAPAFQGEGETITVFESTTVSFFLGQLRPTATDNISVSDTPSGSTSESTATLRPATSDGILVSESVTRAFPTIGITGISESVTLTEFVGATIASFLPSLSVNLQEVIGITDTLLNAYVSPTVWTFGERIVVTDAVNVKLISFAFQTENITVSETPRLRITPLRVGADDLVTIVETLIPYIKDETSEPLIVLPSSETVSVTETVFPHIPFSLTEVSDSIGIVEVVTVGGLHVFQSVSEDIVLTESVSVNLAGLRVSASDAVSLSDTVDVLRTPLILFPSESVTVIESLTIRSFDLRPTISETITLTETYVYPTENPGVAPVSTFVGPWFLYAGIL
jgi:hypothetical protein